MFTFLDSSMLELIIRFGIDIAAVSVLIFGMFYRRHHDKELVTTAVMFNFSAFGVLTHSSGIWSCGWLWFIRHPGIVSPALRAVRQG